MSIVLQVYPSGEIIRLCFHHSIIYTISHKSKVGSLELLNPSPKIKISGNQYTREHLEFGKLSQELIKAKCRQP